MVLKGNLNAKPQTHQQEQGFQKQAMELGQTGLSSDFICLQKAPSESLLRSEI